MSVQNDDDLSQYRKAGLEDRVGHLIKREAHNLAGNRNTILQWLGSGENVVILDDDIKGISKLSGDRLRPLETLEEFEKLLMIGFGEAVKNRTCLWGVYPVHNEYFMKHIRKKRNIIEGTFLGIRVTDLRFDESIDTKEDYDFGCRVIRKYGAAVRLDNYACNAPHFTAGGCGEFWENKKESIKTARMLAGKYPDIIQLNPRREGEVLMKRGKR